MPSDLNRKPFKFNCSGLDLFHPVDMMPPTYFPYINNCRSLIAGTVGVRPGYSQIGTHNLGDPIHSIRRMNNLLPGANPASALFMGIGTNLYAGDPNGPFLPIAASFSGNPLTSVIFRPDQSPEPWIYIADQNKMVKCNCAETVRNVGVAPPTVAPTPEISTVGGVRNVTNNGIIEDGNSNTGWTGGGTGGAVAVNTRVPAATTVSNILYDSGSNGWACLSPQNAAGSYGFLQPGCRLILTGSGGPETVTVTEVHADIPDTTIAGIIYDSGSTGLCSIALSTQTPNLARNSILLLGVTSTVRVLSVTVGPDGLSSLRCSAPHTHVAGDAVRSVVSFRCYTTISIPAPAGGGPPTSATTITGNALEIQITVGTGYATKTQSIDLSLFAFVNGSNRPLMPDDYLHISLRFDVPTAISSGRLMLDVDPVTNDFTQNFFYKEFRQSDLQSAASGTLTSIVTQQTAIQNQVIDNSAPDSGAISVQLGTGTAQWTELFIKLADLVRVGTNQSVGLADVKAIRVELTTTATVIMDFSAWWVAGSYGPDVQTGSPVGIQYQYRYRDSRTGAKSVPGPPCRFDLYPLRQQITVGVTASSDPQVDKIDIQRFDPSLATLVYVGSTANVTGNFNDDTQSSLIAGNPSLETNVFQPWPVLDTPKSGIVTVAGTSVTWISGDQFQTSLILGTVILIGNDAVQIYGQPHSTTFLELVSNLGALTNVAYSIVSPTLLGQPLPVMFGPMEGPTAIYAFGIGDSRNPGTVYWTNGNDLDSASDANTVEVTSPSEPLVSGVVWQTLVFVASAKRVFLGTPNFGQTSTGSPTINFTFTELTSISGSFSPWGMCKGPQGVYMVGRDGLYVLNYNDAKYYSQQIYPLFPHDGQAAAASTNSFTPVLMTNPAHLLLTYCDGSLYFDYFDVNSNASTMEIDTSGNYWPHSYANVVISHYWEEVPEGVEPRLLMGTFDGFLMMAGGTTDNGATLNGGIRTPSLDFDDPRSLKLFMDLMTDSDAPGGYTCTLGFNNYSVTMSTFAGGTTGRSQQLNSVSSTAAAGLVLYRNIAAFYILGAGALLYEFEPSFYLQPFYSKLYTTQLMDHGIPGWKQLRFGRIALISTSSVLIQILNDDGVTLNSFTVPSTSGILFNDFVQLQNASKGRLLRYSASSDSEFVLFVDKTFVRLKKWGGPQFLEIAPFLQ